MKMGKKSRRISEAKSREQKGSYPCAIVIGYGKANTDNLKGTIDGPFIGYRGGRASKRLHEVFALGLVGDVLPPEVNDPLLQFNRATGMLS